MSSPTAERAEKSAQTPRLLLLMSENKNCWAQLLGQSSAEHAAQGTAAHVSARIRLHGAVADPVLRFCRSFSMPGLSYNSILGHFMVFTTDAEVCALNMWWAFGEGPCPLAAVIAAR